MSDAQADELAAMLADGGIEIADADALFRAVKALPGPRR